MPAKTTILGPDNKTEALVTPRGELVVGSIDYSTPYYKTIAVANTAYEIIKGKAGKKIVITDIFMASDKNFASATVSEPVNIYAAHPADIEAILGTILNRELLKNDKFDATGMRLITDEACSVVGIATTDAAINITVAGYYVDA